jgi:hypothetical protein
MIRRTSALTRSAGVAKPRSELRSSIDDAERTLTDPGRKRGPDTSGLTTHFRLTANGLPSTPEERQDYETLTSDFLESERSVALTSWI